MENSSFQILWEDGERVVCRGRRLGADDNWKAVLAMLPAGEQPAPSSLDRLAHEYELKDELDGAWAVRPLELVHEGGRTMLVLEDPGGEPLATLLGEPMELGHFLGLAIGIASALGKVHQRGLVHKDIKPANILVNGADAEVRLTGFGIASRLSRERQAPEPPEVIAGTLAYMAPEQTGRMNRSIDARSDLYALGVTFYQMLTGTLPFNASDAMEWVHCHVARQPMPPSERVKEIPGAVSAIIMKLLAKTAEERYQTAAGIERDLRRCLEQWEAESRVGEFPLGEHDIPDRLLIPEKLYGRDREIETLLTAFEGVVTSGTPELVLVSGYSGIGKSAVVHELHKELVPPRGLFASGKFDQYKRDIPYATLAQAFQILIRDLLGKSDAELAPWRDALSEALGLNGQLVIDVVPELKLIIGDQPPVPELPPQDAQRRFQLVFRRFIGVFARPEHPLALFLDDLQWLDTATLELLEDLLTRSDVQHVMLIGAYRDNEVTAAHPLRRKLDAIRTAGGKVEEITLAPLAREHLGQLIADALRCEAEHAAPLAHLIHDKTGGNPFFALQFLSSLAEEEMLVFDHEGACWAWDLDRIHAKGYTDNVVELMVGKLTRLPPTTQEALQQFACLGNIADIATLSIVLGVSEDEVHAALWPAVVQEWVQRSAVAYRFVHDRVQEAAYGLIPEGERAAAHVRIGRILAASNAPEEIEGQIFEIANHLNRGAELIANQAERDGLAELNLRAGRRAKSSTAHQSALAYLTAGRALLSKDCWDRQYPLAFALELHLAECEFLTGDAAAEERLSKLSERARNLVDMAAVASLRQVLYTMLDRLDRSVDVALDYLRKVGVEWTARPTQDEVAREYEEMFAQLENRPIEEMAGLPRMSDPECSATVEVLTELVPAAYFTNIDLCSLVVCRIANLSFEHGNSNGSVYAYSLLGFLLRTRFGNSVAGFRFGTLALKLADERGLDRFRARVCLNFAYCVNPWTRHIQTGRPLLRRGLTAAKESGDLTFAAYLYYCLVTDLLASGDPLDQVQREAESGLEFASQTKFGLVVDILTGHLRLIRALRGLTVDLGSFSDAAFEEHRFQEHLERDPRLANPTCIYWIRKLQARYFAGDYAAAVAAGAKAEPLLWTSPASFEKADYHFYAGLARAAHHDTTPVDERTSDIQVVTGHHRQLETWAEHCPENFENRAALVGAEIARIEGRELDAECLYEQAIHSARDNRFVHNEALANELASRFYRARGFETTARAYLREARYSYLRWGADGKVRQLDELYPHLREAESTPAPTGTIGTRVEHLDLATVIKVSQAVSSEIVVEKLVDTLLRMAVEHAGAERGVLILARGNELRIQAEASTSGSEVKIGLRDAPISGAELPETVVQYAARTQESVVLDDASARGAFSRDEYVNRTRARSVLSVPLVKQGRLVAVLYLENNLAPSVFTPERTALLKVLAAEAALALENGRLYRELQEREARIRRLVDANIVGVLSSDLDGQILEANDAFLEMVGYTRDDLAAGLLRWTDLTPPEWQPASQQAVTQIRETGTCDVFEKEYFRRDGSRVPVLIGAAAATEEAKTETVAFVLDLTERKRAEAELRESEQNYRMLFESIDEGFCTIEVLFDENKKPVDYRFLQISPSFERQTGIKNAAGRRMREIAPQHEEDWFEIYGKIALTGEPMRFENEAKQLGRWYDVYAFRVEDPKRRRVGILFKDITDRKRAEEALQQAQAELAHVARVMTMGVLTSSIAHEVNQPLGAVVTNASAALRWLAAQPPNIDEARETLGRIIRDGHRAGEVIGRVRTLLKKTATVRARVDLNGLIGEAVTLLQGELRRHRILLRTELAHDLAPVVGDRVQLQQVVLNLMMNGIEVMKELMDRPRELLIASRLDASGAVLVAVKDVGIGLDPQGAERVFEPFYTTKAEGLGMGLTICRSIIEAHGGRLWASANEPSGAVFQFTLPPIQDETAPVEHAGSRQ
jgi:PAS domain S-box-containing protein